MKNILFFGLLCVCLLQACAGDTNKTADSKVTSTSKEVKQMGISKKDTVASTISVAEKTATKDGKVQIDAASFLKEGGTSIEVVDKTGKTVKIDMAQPKVVAKETKIKKDGTKAKVVKPVSKVAPSKNALPVDVNIQQPKVTIAEQPKVEEIKEKPPVETIKESLEELVKIEKVSVFDHNVWNDLLQKYVTNSGKVDYKGFKSDAKFESYLEDLKNNPIQADWSKGKKMAYWINAYNAFTIKLITDNYPVSSITDLEGGKPWDKKWIKLGDKTYSLNNIENDILRPTYKDARIHFAVNCAAKSCPTLLNKAWTADNLERNFEKQAKAFINNVTFNNIDEKSVSISKIFDWYAVDFGNIIEYLNKYSDTTIKSNAKINYQEYDWSLNKQ